MPSGNRRRSSASCGPCPMTTLEPGRSSERKASRFFSTAIRPTLTKIGRGRSRSIACSGLNISVSTPRVHMPRFLKPRWRELGHQRRRRYHRDGRGGVEAAQRRVGPGLGDRNARRDVFGKPGRVAGGERQSVLQAVGAHRVGRSGLRSRYGWRPVALARCAARSPGGSAGPGASPDRSAPEGREIPPARGNRS